MVVGVLIAVAAGIAICHTHHKKQQRFHAFKEEYIMQRGGDTVPMTKQEWKQVCHEYKQARKAEKHARKAERHMRRAERQASWRTSLPMSGGGEPMSPFATRGEPEVALAKGNMSTTYNWQDEKQQHQYQQREIPVQGAEADEPPSYVAAPREKM
ncbi:hypothetical protein NQ176_g10916 [Zarea fungicola]|uniref:Uncharacterized protein n=1 Tax=Zarea fungicola TaxID=93591 RepID=A0ACC1MDH1_9HYPO|nr:hypothetical protein NQ176_g10916 [Lecanicillium fungicola]